MAVAKLDGARRELPATLVEVAEHRLRDAILRGALQPGEKSFTEAEIAAIGERVVAAAAKLGATLRG